MANVGTAPSGRTLIGAGNTTSPRFAALGTDSGLTAGGVVIAQGNNAFTASTVGSAGEVLTSNGPGLSPTFQPAGGGPGTDLHVARFIVHPTAASANYTTITAAIAAASAGDTIAIQSKATAYNEDFTLPTGINLVAYSADAYTPNVVVKGKITCTSAGSRSISGIQLETDGDNIIEITGANAVELNLINCYLDMADATGIDINNANATVNCFHCKGNLQTTGIAIFDIAQCSMMNFEYCYFDNTGDSTTANAIASGNIRQWWTRFANPVSVTGDAEITQRWARIECSPLDVTCLTLNTSNDGSNSFHSVYSSSDADGIVLTAGELRLSFADISTDIAFDAISGAGSLEYSAVSFRESNAVTVSSQKTYSFRQGKPPFEEITGTSHTAIPGGHYIANNGSLVTITLPSVFEVGDIVWIVGKGAGLWALDCPAGDVIHFGNQDTSSGGTITATNRYDAIQVVGTVANSEWTCTGVSQGNLTVA